MWSIQSKHREMQGITEVWILSASCRDKCCGWVLIGTSIICAVMQRQPSRSAPPERPAQAHLCGSACKPPHLQHSLLPAPPGRSNAVPSTLCTRGFFFWIMYSELFPGVLLQWVVLVKRLAPGAHLLPSVQFCSLHCHLAAPGSPLVQDLQDC